MTDYPPQILPKPPWAGYIWADADSIWIELPCPTGKAPVLCQFSKSEGGLSKALSLIDQCMNVKKTPPLPGHYKAYHEQRAKPPSSFPLANLSKRPDLKASVAAAMKKVGIL